MRVGSEDAWLALGWLDLDPADGFIFHQCFDVQYVKCIDLLQNPTIIKVTYLLSHLLSVSSITGIVQFVEDQIYEILALEEVSKILTHFTPIFSVLEFLYFSTSQYIQPTPTNEHSVYRITHHKQPGHAGVQMNSQMP